MEIYFYVFNSSAKLDVCSLIEALEHFADDADAFSELLFRDDKWWSKTNRLAMGCLCEKTRISKS